MNGAFFSGTCLLNVDFRGADLRKAHFKGAVIENADFSFDKNSKKRTDLSEADIEQSQIDQADGDVTTILPKALHMPEKWKYLLKNGIE